MSDHDITLGSAVALSRAIQERTISCEEVMARYLARIATFNPRYNALVSLRDPEALVAEARQRDAQLAAGQSLGWLHGLPLAPKDLTDAQGLPTTMGSPLLGRTPARADSLQVSRMRAAGGIVIGKSNTPEFGLGSHTFNEVFGATRNAWNPELSAGGSSGGAAVALALRMLPVADGSDMMGSLRNPAAWNQVYGLRPTPGRVPAWPAADVFFQQLGLEGPMARTVEDLAALLAVQSGYDPRCPLSWRDDPAALAEPWPARPLRVGWLGDFQGYLPIEAGVMAACRAALDALDDLGHEVQEVVPFFPMEDLWQAWIDLRSFLVSGALAPSWEQPATRARLKPEAVWEVERGLALCGRDVYRASTTRTRWHQAVLQALEQYDVLLLPSAQLSPFPVEWRWPEAVAGRTMDSYHRWMEVVVPGSMAAVPVLNMPAGFDDRGMPAGLQCIAAPGQERLLFALAQGWQASGAGQCRLPPALAAATAD